MNLSESYSHACKRCKEVGFGHLPEFEQWGPDPFFRHEQAG